MNSKFLIETDFLFGLRPSDRLNKHINSFILDIKNSRELIILSGASLIEVPLVLLGEEKSNLIVQETITAMKLALQSLTKYTIQNFEFSDIITAFRLRKDYNTSFFDSLHIATALNSNLTLLTSDKNAIDTIIKEGGKSINILNY